MAMQLKAIAAATLALVALQAQAAPVVYLGSNDNVSTLAQMVNAQAAKASFLGVAGNGLTLVDFESALPGNITISGGNTGGSTCGAVCGFNTTAGGSLFRTVSGGSVTFSFTNPVDAFGFFVNGLQTDLVPQQTIVYVDGSSVTQTINFPPAINGGGAFVGFIDYGQQISSVTFNATNDVLGFDDLLFGNSARDPGNQVPLPGTLALALAGLAAVGGLRRRAA